MRRLQAVAIGIASLAILTGCATGAGNAGAGNAGAGSPTPTPTASPAPTVAELEMVAAKAQAQAWLDAAALPPGALPAKGASPGFSSYQGWPCRPVAEIKAYWRIPDSTVAEVERWFRANPTADLVSTAVGQVSDDPSITSAMVGYIPGDNSHQGIVYSIAKRSDGIAVRAEIAALTESAVCPELPEGGVWGKPGQG